MSHISEDRQADLLPKMESSGIDVDAPTPHKEIQQLAFDSFKTNFSDDLMEKAKELYVQTS
jgi:3-methyladenine DNA glycosylase AlkC